MTNRRNDDATLERGESSEDFLCYVGGLPAYVSKVQWSGFGCCSIPQIIFSLAIFWGMKLNPQFYPTLRFFFLKFEKLRQGETFSWQDPMIKTTTWLSSSNLNSKTCDTKWLWYHESLASESYLTEGILWVETGLRSDAMSASGWWKTRQLKINLCCVGGFLADRMHGQRGEVIQVL